MTVDRNSETWAAIEKWAREEFAAAHRTLEAADEKETERARGRIIQIRALLGLGKKSTEPEVVEMDNYGLADEF